MRGRARSFWNSSRCAADGEPLRDSGVGRNRRRRFRRPDSVFGRRPGGLQQPKAGQAGIQLSSLVSSRAQRGICFTALVGRVPTRHRRSAELQSAATFGKRWRPYPSKKQLQSFRAGASHFLCRTAPRAGRTAKPARRACPVLDTGASAIGASQESNQRKLSGAEANLPSASLPGFFDAASCGVEKPRTSCAPPSGSTIAGCSPPLGDASKRTNPPTLYPLRRPAPPLARSAGGGWEGGGAAATDQ